MDNTDRMVDTPQLLVFSTDQATSREFTTISGNGRVDCMRVEVFGTDGNDNGARIQVRAF